MGNQSVTVQVDKDDAITANLARGVLVAEIAFQVLTCIVVLEMLDKGRLTYKAAWYWRRWTAKAKAQAARDRELRRELGRLLFDISEFEKGASHGQG